MHTHKVLSQVQFNCKKRVFFNQYLVHLSLVQLLLYIFGNKWVAPSVLEKLPHSLIACVSLCNPRVTPCC